MSKKPLLISLMAILLLSACEQENTNDVANDKTEITGVATIGLFSGTEIGCEYGDIGSSVGCNAGSGTIYLEMAGEKIYLKDYTCPAVEFFVNDESGKHVEYRASDKCDGEIIIGETYTATGELTVAEDVWRDGEQIDEQLLKVDSIVLEN